MREAYRDMDDNERGETRNGDFKLARNVRPARDVRPARGVRKDDD